MKASDYCGCYCLLKGYYGKCYCPNVHSQWSHSTDERWGVCVYEFGRKLVFEIKKNKIIKKNLSGFNSTSAL